MIDQDKIHNQCLSKDSKECILALVKLKDHFSSLPNKQQAWEDLLRLTTDKDRIVRSNAASTICSMFSQVPDKQKAWNDLVKLIYDKNSDVRYQASYILNSVFSQVPDKQKAWNELVKLTSEEEWKVRSKAVTTLGSLFFDVPDKQQAWNNLVTLTSDEKSDVRYQASYILNSAFPQVPDKRKAWKNLHDLTYHEDSAVRSNAANALCSAFSQIPNKQQAWEDLHKLANDEDSSVRYYAASTFGSVFSQVPDKQQAWEDLLTLTNDEDSGVRSNASSALGSIFSQVPDKQQAWNHLHRLVYDEDNGVRSNAASTLGSVFSQIPNKQQAWNDLHGLTNDEDRCVRSSASFSLGSAFSQIPDKEQALNDLNRLTIDEYGCVRTFANHSLGKVSIFKASKAENEEDYKKELENAIEFFEIAIIGSPDKWYSPPKFCLLFYRSFYTIIFNEQESGEEVNKYLEEAKSAIEDSKSKKRLFEAVENLANALKEVQRLKSLNLKTKKSELNFYRIYCDRATELMKNAEEEAPFATIAIRKGLPILNRYLKELLEEIRKKTEIICEQTRGTQFEELGYELSQNSQFLSQIRDPVGLEKQVNSLQNIVRDICSKFPEGQKGEACELLKVMYTEPLIEDKIPLMVNILSKFSYQLDIITHLNEVEEKLEQKLNCISFNIFKIKLNSHNVISNLDIMKKELEKLNNIESSNTYSIEKLNSIQADKLNDLTSNILERLDEIKILIYEFSKDNDEFYQEFSKRLDEIKQSKLDMSLQRYTAIISLMDLVISWIPIAR